MFSRLNGHRMAQTALAVGFALWLIWILGLVEVGFETDTDGNVLGVDHSIFHTAGQLVRSGDADLLYTTSEFNALLTQVREQPAAKSTPHYLHPPGVAYAFALPSLLPRTMAWLALGALGLIAAGFAYRMIGIGKVSIAVAITALSLPGWLNFRLGQLGPIWLLIFAAVYVLLRSDRLALAGAVSGLLALKPQFGLALALWWAFDFVRYRVALTWSALTAATITVVTFALTPRSFSGFFDAAGGAVDDPKFPIGYSLNDTILGWFPSLPDVPVAIAVAALGVAGLFVVVRRHRQDVALQFAAATLAAVWMTPHLIAYDWMLLGGGLAALWVSRPEQRNGWLNVASVISLSSALAWIVAQLGRELFDIRLELAAVGLAVVALAAYRELAAADSGSSRTISPSV